MEKEIVQLKEMIEDTIHHPFLVEHIQQPVIDEYKLFFLNYLLSNASLNPKTRDNLLIAIMLVQIALDIHEQVPNNHEEEDMPITTNSQLSILAGDFYSGLYYWLLANISEHRFIRVLATAIKQINEVKMQRYFAKHISSEEQLVMIKQIESLLITNIAKELNMTIEIPVIEEILLTNYLSKQIVSELEYPTQSELQTVQIKNTTGIIESLPVSYSHFKSETKQLLDSILYNTAWEKEY